MSLAMDHLPMLFGTPGLAPTACKKLLHQVASVHAELFTKAIGFSPALRDPSSSCLLQFLDGPSPSSTKRKFLCHSQVIEALHILSPHCSQLDHWHRCVTADDRQQATDNKQMAVLGNLALVVLLGIDSDWCGEIPLATDVLGRLSFPFSDWTISLSDGKQEILANQVIHLQLDGEIASFRLKDDDTWFLTMPRADCVLMIADNSEMVDLQQLLFPNPKVKPKLCLARKIGLSPIRYDPIAFLDYDSHAGLTGGIIQRILSAIQCNSPAVYREFCSFIHSIRGFEFQLSSLGVVGSFSDPTLPGVMSFNVSYAENRQPRLDPFCFTWFGHEMGHSKNYLIDTVLYGEGISLVLNPGDRSDIVPRYGRSFTVRTLFQIPYVHLYEWALLMDFAEAGFRGLPWIVPSEYEALGDDIGLEIEEAFAHIDRFAHLSAWGQRALAYFHELFDQAKMRWQALRQRSYKQSIVNS
jgi:hypothetical protein